MTGFFTKRTGYILNMTIDDINKFVLNMKNKNLLKALRFPTSNCEGDLVEGFACYFNGHKKSSDCASVL